MINQTVAEIVLDKSNEIVEHIYNNYNFFELDWIGLPLATLESEIKKEFFKKLKEECHNAFTLNLAISYLADVDWEYVASEIYGWCEEEEAAYAELTGMGDE